MELPPSGAVFFEDKFGVSEKYGSFEIMSKDF